jgi:hypothetical protein
MIRMTLAAATVAILFAGSAVADPATTGNTMGAQPSAMSGGKAPAACNGTAMKGGNSMSGGNTMGGSNSMSGGNSMAGGAKPANGCKPKPTNTMGGGSSMSGGSGH